MATGMTDPFGLRLSEGSLMPANSSSHKSAKSSDSSRSIEFTSTPFIQLLGANTSHNTSKEGNFLSGNKNRKSSILVRSSVVSNRMELMRDKRMSIESRRDTALSEYEQLYKRFSTNSRFEDLKPDVLRSLLAGRPDYQTPRDMAIILLQCDVFRRLQIIYRSNVCTLENYQEKVMPNRMFSWSVEDFKMRRNLTSNIWIDILRKDIPPECLELRKVNIDLEELMKLIQVIFDVFEGRVDLEEAVKCVNDASHFMRLFKELLEELAKNKEAFRMAVNQTVAFVMLKRDPKQEQHKLELEEELTNYEAHAPIEMRFQMQWLAAKQTQSELKLDQIVKQYEEEVNRYYKQIRSEEYCAQCIMNVYYTQIENFKTDFVNLTAKYDKEMEEIENELSYKRLSLGKLQEQRKFLTEQIKRFHEEIEETRLEEIREHEMELRAEQEQLARELAKKMKKGKGKGKGKPNKSKK